MPNRIIREAILSSESVASLGWAEEVFYRRLMSIVDDYGRYEASPKLLRAKCYPMQIDDVTADDVEKWLHGAQKAGLISLYAANGKNYLQINKFQQQTRTASKFPAIDSECSQMISSAHLDVVVSVGGDVSVSVGEKATVRFAALPDGFEAFWNLYPNRKARSKAESVWKKLKPTPALQTEILEKLAVQTQFDDDWRRGFIPHGATYLNQKRWQDPIAQPRTQGTPDGKQSLIARAVQSNQQNQLRDDAERRGGPDLVGSDDCPIRPEMVLRPWAGP